MKTEHPDYYNRYSIEAVEMARRIWGDEALCTTAEITAFFYRMRAGMKPDNPAIVDFSKEDFWLEYAKKIRREMKKEDTIELVLHNNVHTTTTADGD